jgi:hypothetical protein
MLDFILTGEFQLAAAIDVGQRNRLGGVIQVDVVPGEGNVGRPRHQPQKQQRPEWSHGLSASAARYAAMPASS